MKGGVGAIVGIFVEAAKQVVDLVQILLHFATLKKYQPRFVSDMAEAAKQGKTTGDLLKGMVTGLIETPGRFLKGMPRRRLGRYRAGSGEYLFVS